MFKMDKFVTAKKKEPVAHACLPPPKTKKKPEASNFGNFAVCNKEQYNQLWKVFDYTKSYVESSKGQQEFNEIFTAKKEEGSLQRW